jgi:hypothetical protein
LFGAVLIAIIKMRFLPGFLIEIWWKNVGNAGIFCDLVGFWIWDGENA